MIKAVVCRNIYYLPQGPHRILINQVVRGEDREVFNYRLTHEHSVKWVSMQRRKSAEVESRLFIEREGLDIMLLSLGRNKLRGRFWERKSPDRIFDCDFPRGNRAQKNIVVRIGKQFARSV